MGLHTEQGTTDSTDSPAKGLGELHKLHIKLQETQDKLDRGPRQIQARKQFALQKQQELRDTEESHKQARMKADDRALQLKTNEGKIEQLKLKLNTANSNKEFGIFKGQIEADTVANSVLEDEILEGLEKIDESSAAVAKAREERATAEASAEDRAREVQAAESGLQAQIAELNQAIRAAEVALSGDVATAYRRLVETYGSGALAPVQNNVCSNCYVGITAQMSVRLNSGAMIFCKTCGRLLYPEAK